MAGFFSASLSGIHKKHPQTKTHPSGLSREVLHGAVRIDCVQFYDWSWRQREVPW